MAFAFGLPLAALILVPLRLEPLASMELARYVKHNVECVEVILFCCAMAALAAKFIFSTAERAVCDAEVLPPWDGRPVPVSEAPNLLAAVQNLPARLRNTYLGRRVTAVVEFLCQRQSAAELDDHLRGLTDNDALALEGTYALTRFITWAIPILGFLGTVLGITQAIAAVTPEKLEHDISGLTNGLALAFDATALGLALTMLTMFCSFLVERREQAVLDAVDHYVERQLAHRFLRAGADAAPVLEAIRQNSQVLLDAAGQLVQRQADVWGQSMQEVQRRAADWQASVQERLAAAVEAALERTLDAHARRLAGLEQKAVDQSGRLYEQMATLAAAVRDTAREQQAALTQVGEAVAGQAAVLARVQEGEQALVQSQSVLQQNLQALAASGQFDQALHSLTAAVHLLTARAGALAELPNRPGPTVLKPLPGKAA
jgi:biopolymer transport protein ExbB/TolQ